MDWLITLLITIWAIQSDILILQILAMLFIVGMLMIEIVYLIFKWKEENER